ncbi:hypothetical protein ETR_09131, partial [Erwinia tracheiphila PSU-1]
LQTRGLLYDLLILILQYFRQFIVNELASPDVPLQGTLRTAFNWPRSSDVISSFTVTSFFTGKIK